jgi:hypothetical protein
MTVTPRLSWVLFLALICIALTGCKSKITKANYEKVSEGMNLKEVENILGEGSKLGDGSGIAAQAGVNLPGAATGRGDTYVWESGDKKITIIFVQDKVKWKDSKGL